MARSYLRGYQVDTVAWKLTLMPCLEDDASTKLCGMVFRIWQLQMALQVDICPVDAISSKETFWRTLCGDTIYNPFMTVLPTGGVESLIGPSLGILPGGYPPYINSLDSHQV